jgi:hypothetical protein
MMFKWIRNLFSDENDRKLQAAADNARARLQERMAQDGDEESILRHVAETGELPNKRPGRPRKTISTKVAAKG